ncbi:MAG: hypothetical protein C0601_10310 [Candidatus Muiribacterium halophilum]|uniref:Uncharacterized protein n=1 Tax=Muiribacterium halophilum TaxID=2053465 RepID=A0A2N5ZCE8_MUIH1|nr:MAG: hypothetical protein C0601_10310 [Candidatus Muirbacterium halophilum]
MAIFDYKEILRQKLCQERSKSYEINTRLSSYPVVSEYLNSSEEEQYLIFNTSNNYILKVSDGNKKEEEEIIR